MMPMFPGPVVDVVVPKTDQKLFLDRSGQIEGSYLFYPAQFWQHKNHINLLKALKILKEKFDLIVPLVLVGSDKGNLNEVIANISLLGLSSQVHYMGFVSLSEQRTLYENALALVMPTFLGPTNMPPLEAITIGCPVICSDLPGHREQLKDAALYFDPYSSEDLAEKIKSFVQNKELQKILLQNAVSLKLKRSFSVHNAVLTLLHAFDSFASSAKT